MIVITLDEAHANQFLASMDSNHFNIKVFDDIKDQIVSQMASPVVETAPAAAVAAFMDGVPHEQFDEEAEEEEAEEK
ncbi:MAG: hypothetical protein WCK82_12480 [Bacteroidota bacterium]